MVQGSRCQDVWGLRRGCPGQLGEGFGEWTVPTPQKIFQFLVSKWWVLNYFGSF